MQSKRKNGWILLLLCLFAMVSLVASLTLGSSALKPQDAVTGLFGYGDPLTIEIVRHLRLPRTIAAFACGGLLAYAGALLQVLLRNPLADPYVLGVSGGAGVGAILALFFGLSAMAISVSAFSGAFGVMLLVFGLAQSDSSRSQTRLLLTGVVVASGCAAVVALILSMTPDHRVHGMLFWLMGDLAQARQPWIALAVLAGLLLLVAPFARDLNLLSRGGDVAQMLGVSVKRIRHATYLLSSLATAIAVTQAGSIGFIGLVVPHLVRMLVGNDQRFLLPAVVLAGGALLVVADTAARIMLAPQQLPVGVLTALIGVPVFLYLLMRDGRRGSGHGYSG